MREHTARFGDSGFRPGLALCRLVPSLYAPVLSTARGWAEVGSINPSQQAGQPLLSLGSWASAFLMKFLGNFGT